MKKNNILSIVTCALLITFAVSAGGSYAYDFGEFDLGGQTITIQGLSEAQLEEFKESGRWEDAEEKFNINLRTWDHGLGSVQHIEGLMSRFMAGDADNDIWFIHFQQPQSGVQLALEGVAYPVSDFLTQEYYDDYLPHMASKMARQYSFHGETYGFGSAMEMQPGIRGLSFYAYNVEIFEAEGLPDLQDLYDAGEWTWDRLRDIAVQATRDTTGDGEFDQIGISDSPGVHRQVDYQLVTNGGQLARWIDGRVVATIDEEPVIETIEFMRDLHERGVMSWGRDRTGWIEGQYAMFNGAGSMWYLPNIQREMDAEFRIVPMPIGPSAEEDTQPIWSTTTMLPISSNNPEAKVAIYHYLFPAEEMEQAVRGYFEENVRDRRSYEILLDLYFDGNLSFVAGEHNDLYGISQVSFTDALTGEKTPSALMAEQKPELQARLDDIFGQ